MAERFIQSIDRAADVLELFLTADQHLAVKEISEKLGLSKSTVHGIIKTLEHRGFLQQNPDDLKYKLGMKLFELGNRVASQLDIAEITRPIIKELVEVTKETVHLVVYEGGEVIYVEKMDGPMSLRIYSQVGKKAPVHCTGVGKSILAFLEEEEVDLLLSNAKMERFTEYTLTDKAELKLQLKTVREQGYAMEDEEIERGLKCVAEPIFKHQGKVIAAISCASPKIRLDEDKLTQVINGVKQAAAQISAKMGYQS